MSEEPMRFRRGQVLLERGLYQAAVEEWTRALSEADTPLQRVRIQNGITGAYLELGFWEEADEASAQAMREVVELPRRHPYQIAVRFNRSMYLASVGRFQEADTVLAELSECIRGQSGIQHIESIEHQKFGIALETGDFRRLEAISKEALASFARLGKRQHASLLTNLAIYDMYEGRLEEAEAKLWQARGLTDVGTPARERLALTSEFARLAILRSDNDRLGTWLGECGRLVAEDPAETQVLELGRLAVFLGIGLHRSGNREDGERLRTKGLQVLAHWHRDFEREYLARLPVDRRGTLRFTARLAFLKRLLLALPLVRQEPEPAALYAERVGPLLYSGLTPERAAQMAAWSDYLPEHAQLLTAKDPPPEARVAKLLKGYSRQLRTGQGYRKALVTLLTEEGFDTRMSQRLITLHVA